MIADWSTINSLQTPAGNLTLNAASGARYLTIEDACSSGADLRFTFDLVPQSDGQLNHQQYLTGYSMSLALALWSDDAPACGGDAQEMLDDLGVCLDALRNPTSTTRIVWTPEGMASRMVNDIDLSSRPVVRTSPRGDESGIVTVTFTVVSEFPYEMSESERTPATLTGGTGLGTALDNQGNTAFYPVFKVYGPAGDFELHNLTTGKALYYESGRPGAGFVGTSEYIEIDTFRGTMVWNGDRDDSAIAGLNPETSTFWTLIPGENDVALIGADTATVLFNDAWL